MAVYVVNGTEYSIADKLVLLDKFQCSISETNTQVTFELRAGTQFKNKRSTGHVFAERTLYLTGTGQTTASGTIHEFALPGGKSKYYEVIDRTWTYTKGTTATTKTISAYTSGHSATKASKAFTIPALKSYAVTYNANGGTGAPTSQTKYYGQTLTITTSKPTRAGYTFKGWATTSARADAGYIDYASGASYTSNSALTLYAVWDLNYVKPIITNVSVERCNSNGVLDDEGTYARVAFDWSIDVAKYPSNTVDSLTTTVGSITKTYSVSGSSGTVADTVGTGTYDTDTSYAVTITLADTSGETANSSTWTGALGLTMFPLDISADGNSVGICRPAPDNTHGIFLGDNLDVNGGVKAHGDIEDGSGNVLSDLAVTTQTLTLSSYFKPYNNNADSAPVFKHSGHVCEVTGIVSPNSTISGSNSRTKICDIPTGYEPTSQMVTVCQGSGNARWTCEISKGSTEVTFSRYCNTGSAANSYNNCDTNQWLPFHIVWIV